MMTLNPMDQISWASSVPFIKVCPNYYHMFFSFRFKSIYIKILACSILLSVFRKKFTKFLARGFRQMEYKLAMRYDCTIFFVIFYDYFSVILCS